MNILKFHLATLNTPHITDFGNYGRHLPIHMGRTILPAIIRTYTDVPSYWGVYTSFETK